MTDTDTEIREAANASVALGKKQCKTPDALWNNLNAVVENAIRSAVATRDKEITELKLQNKSLKRTAKAVREQNDDKFTETLEMMSKFQDQLNDADAEIKTLKGSVLALSTKRKQLEEGYDSCDTDERAMAWGKERMKIIGLIKSVRDKYAKDYHLRRSYGGPDPDPQGTAAARTVKNALTDLITEIEKG